MLGCSPFWQFSPCDFSLSEYSEPIALLPSCRSNRLKAQGCVPSARCSSGELTSQYMHGRDGGSTLWTRLRHRRSPVPWRHCRVYYTFGCPVVWRRRQTIFLWRRLDNGGNAINARPYTTTELCFFCVHWRLSSSPPSKPMVQGNRSPQPLSRLR